MKVQQNNLFKQNKIFYKNFIYSFKKAIKDSNFIGGEEITKFETNFKRLFESKYCVSVANGTDALIIALRCLEVKNGDEVILPTHSWVSTAGAIIAVGAKPVFVDTDEYFTINVNKIEASITNKTKVIIPVHLYGQACKMSKILEIAKKYKLKIIEDCAQAHLTKYKGKIVGNFGDVGTFSFFPGKNMGALGDAGAIICRSKILFESIKKYKNHGGLKKNEHEMFGINSRLDAVQAKILNQKMVKLKNFNSKRIKNSQIYYKLLAKNKFLDLPLVRKNCAHTFHQFVIKIKKNRYKLIKFLSNKGIQTTIHYPKLLINLKPYEIFKKKENFEYSLSYEKKIISLPMHPFLTKKEIEYVCKNINLFFKQND